MTASSQSPETLRPQAAAEGRIKRGSFPDLAALARHPELGALLGVIVVYSFFAVVTAGNGFVSVNGTASWLGTSSMLGIVAIPVAMLMIGGEFDLSIGSVIGSTSIFIAIATGHYGLPIGVSILMALALGVLVGIFNGVAVTRTGIHSFIITLVTMLALAGISLGLARYLVGTPSISLRTDGFERILFASKWGQASVSILWWLAIAGVAAWVMSKTRFGSWVMATGGDKESAKQAGIPVERVKITLFVLTTLGAVMVGVLQTVQFNGGEATRGQAYLFNSIIAAVVGGVFLHGGYGSIVGVVLGTMTYGIVSLGIFYTGWNADWAQFLLAILLLSAVLTNNLFHKLALRG